MPCIDLINMMDNEIYTGTYFSPPVGADAKSPNGSLVGAAVVGAVSVVGP